MFCTGNDEKIIRGVLSNKGSEKLKITRIETSKENGQKY